MLLFFTKDRVTITGVISVRETLKNTKEYVVKGNYYSEYINY
jgi:hypothetical protein